MRRSENDNKLRQVTLDNESVRSISLKPPFCSGLKKSNNLSRNLNNIKDYFDTFFLQKCSLILTF
jgi:hypothetical protein